FFFSSRRRHTRLVSDWSSDVCSSDLGTGRGAAGAAAPLDWLGVLLTCTGLGSLTFFAHLVAEDRPRAVTTGSFGIMALVLLCLEIGRASGRGRGGDGGVEGDSERRRR